MPFNTLQSNYTVEVPDPEVEFVDQATIAVKTGKKKKDKAVRKHEVVKHLKSSEYNREFPLSKEDFKLQDLLDAGVSLQEVPTAIYGSDISQKELLNRVEAVIDKAEGTYDKKEK